MALDGACGSFIPSFRRHHLARHIAPVLDPALAASIAKGEDTSSSNAGERLFPQRKLLMNQLRVGCLNLDWHASFAGSKA